MDDLTTILTAWREGEASAEQAAVSIADSALIQGRNEDQALAALREAAVTMNIDSAALDGLAARVSAAMESEAQTQLTQSSDEDATVLTQTPDRQSHPVDGESATEYTAASDAPTEVTARPADDAPTELTYPGDAPTEATAAPDAPTQMTARPTGPPPASGASKGPIGIGSTVKERFVLEAMLGRGGMGAVYRAKDLRRVEAGDRQVHVALKLLNEDFQKHPDAAVALQREAKKAQTLAHPNIVTVYDFDRDGNTLFVSMAYLQGRPLDVLVRENKNGLPVEQALDIIDQMASGLAYAHEKGFAHADFKPGNVFLSKDGNVRILDFGIARAAAVATTDEADDQDADGGEDTRFDPTTLGAITPAYASAEMLEGIPPEPTDDVYALGCAAYELITGRHPYADTDGRKLPAVEAEKIALKPAPLPGIPKRYQKAIARALELRRPGRFKGAGEFQKAVEPPSVIKRVLLASAVVLAVIAGGALYMNYEQSDLAITVENLSPTLAPSKTLIREGDAYMKSGEIEQAHKSYAQAWDVGRQDSAVSARESSRLKVIIDRRVDEVIRRFLEQAQSDDLDQFGLEVMQLSLESLRQSDLGTLDAEITQALEDVNRRIQAAG